MPRNSRKSTAYRTLPTDQHKGIDMLTRMTWLIVPLVLFFSMYAGAAGALTPCQERAYSTCEAKSLTNKHSRAWKNACYDRENRRCMRH